MKAAVLESAQSISAHPLRIRELPQPKPGPGQVLLRVRACGVCRTDLHIVEGELRQRQPELIPGHQIVGEIVEGATAELPVGLRVGVSWIGGVDGTCFYCRRGFENLCDAPTFTGYTVNGGYAEFMRVPSRNVLPIPDDFEFVEIVAAPLAFQTAWRGLITRGRLQAGEDVVILGAGSGVSTEFRSGVAGGSQRHALEAREQDGRAGRRPTRRRRPPCWPPPRWRSPTSG